MAGRLLLKFNVCGGHFQTTAVNLNSYRCVLSGDVDALLRDHQEALQGHWFKATLKCDNSPVLVTNSATAVRRLEDCGYSFISVDSHYYDVVALECVPGGHVGKKLHAALTDDPHVDFVLISADGKEFKVHKLVLKAQSSVLRQLFSNDKMMQADEYLKDGRMKMGETDSEALQAFVSALYTNEYKLKYSEKPEAVLQLLKVVEMYDMSDLKTQIADDLASCATRENAYELATIEKRHNLPAVYSKLFSHLRLK